MQNGRARTAAVAQDLRPTTSSAAVMQESTCVSGLARSLAAGSLPFGLALLGTVVANFPVSFTEGFLPTPCFALMPVYFWGWLRPDLMPPWAVF